MTAQNRQAQRNIGHSFDEKQRQRRRKLIPLGIFFLLLLGCSASSLVTRETPVATPTRVTVPTFTTTPISTAVVIVVTPPSNGTPGVIIVPPGVEPETVLPPTATFTPTEVPAEGDAPPAEVPTTQPGEPTPTPTATLTPTDTPTPSPTPTNTETPLPTLTATPTDTATPTPFIVVDAGLVSLRTGPGVQYPLLAQLAAGVPVSIVGQNPEGGWYQICCINDGQSVWVAASNVRVGNDPTTATLVLSEPAPTPTPTFTPTETGTPTATPTPTLYPFQIATNGGPQRWPTSNEFLTVWIKLTIGFDLEWPPPAEGYRVRAEFVPQANTESAFHRDNSLGDPVSSSEFQWNWPESDDPAANRRREYNLKFEYKPPIPTPTPTATTNPTPTPEPFPLVSPLEAIGNGQWFFWIIDPDGNQVSDKVPIDVNTGNNQREIWIHWWRIR